MNALLRTAVLCIGALAAQKFRVIVVNEILLRPLPVYARTASAAVRIAMQVFPRGERRLRSVRDESGVVWSSPDDNNQQDILLHSSND